MPPAPVSPSKITPGLAKPVASKIRLDPLAGTFNMRGYKEAGDPGVNLADESRVYCMVGSIAIAGHVAVGTALNGDLSDPDLWLDLDAALRARGVTELHWERHKNGRILMKKRRIKT